MPRRTDISTILIIGAGPIVIGQACEFDYSGTQACKALKAEGYRVVLVNSNPATIMTDPDLADRTYVEPITPQIVAKIIEAERHAVPGGFALLPTMGGQTALNCALSLKRMGVLDKFDVELIGASAQAIDKAEDRELFRQAMIKIGLDVPRGRTLKGSLRQKKDERGKPIYDENNEPVMELSPDAYANALKTLDYVGLPAVIRPSYTLGGTGGGVAYNREEFFVAMERGIDASPTNEVLVEESVAGWKEFEMEVVRDRADNCIIVCSIENVDPMGVHTGDSITVAPALTLTDKEYQRMRDASIAVLREIGVDTGGSNVQFAIDPANGRMIIIEMNPRVSRSSALASKATGFPIAKVAAKLAVGYTLDEIENDITGGATPASFEPSIDYVVTKIPRFTFEKFPGADPVLTTSMKSVGEVMAVGRSFAESLQKALRSLETGLTGLDEIEIAGLGVGDDHNAIRAAIGTPTPDRLLKVAQAMRLGHGPVGDFRGLPHRSLVSGAHRRDRADGGADQGAWPADDARRLPRPQGDGLLGCEARGAFRHERSRGQEGAARSRHSARLQAHRHLRCRIRLADRVYVFLLRAAFRRRGARRSAAFERGARSIILGGGPNRIGQGIEFDYCCCHAAFALKEAGFETIMINCNPETVSTDYDTSDRLYFEPLTAEDVLEIIDEERQNGTLHGVIVQFGGQTPLKLARPLEEAGVPILGTSPDAIDLAEDRDRFKRLLEKLNLKQPKNGIAYSVEQSRLVTADLGFPLVVRPSYVLGGRAMAIIHDERSFDDYLLGTLPSLVPEEIKARYPNDKTGQINTLARQEPAALRPISHRRHRGRCGLPLGWRDDLCGRHHGAYRGGGHPLGRFGLFAPPYSLDPATVDRARGADAQARARAQRRRPDECAIRDQGRRHPCARGQSARLAHRALRRQGDRACRSRRSRRA